LRGGGNADFHSIYNLHTTNGANTSLLVVGSMLYENYKHLQIAGLQRC
jgi:hypothetical protein